MLKRVYETLVIGPLHYITEHLNWWFSNIGKGPIWHYVDLSWMKKLDAQWTTVLGEFEDFRRHLKNIPQVQDLRPDGKKDEVYQGDWGGLYLMIAGKKNDTLISYFPKTMKLLESSVPELQSIRLSLLGADRSEIKEHRDGHGHVIVCHLPLIIPEGESSIVVGGRRQPWQTGQSFTIYTSKRHYATKESEEERLVVLISFFRPVPRIIGYLSKFVIRYTLRSLPIDKMFELHEQAIKKDTI
jgi:aspartyl/asparaginyl beta-hydroxylase (cupin superfamily)